MNYAAAYQVIADAYRLGWTCEKVAAELQALGFANERISQLMNTPIDDFLKGKPAPVTLAI